MLAFADPGNKKLAAGTHRIRLPADTLALTLPRSREFGITRVANVTGLDRIGLPVVLVTRPNSRSVAVSQGKGMTLDAAKASAVMEAIELWHAENILQPMVFASHGDIASYGKPIEVSRLPRLAGNRYSETLRTHWLEGFDIVTGEPRLLPHELVHADYRHPLPPGHGCFPSSTNGLASGNHPLEAICHGICEVIERDALTVWHHLPKALQDGTRIYPLSVDDADCQTAMAAFNDAGLQFAIWDVTSDIGIATCLCLVHEPDGDSGHIGLGSGTHLDRGVALRRALTEAAQTRMNYITGSRDDLIEREFTAEGRSHALAQSKALIGRSEGRRSFKNVPTRMHDTLRDDVEWLVKRLAGVGIAEIGCIDLSRPSTGIFVFRIIIPGLEAPHDDEGFVAGPRTIAATASKA